MQNPILIIGASGAIGSAVATKLADRGNQSYYMVDQKLSTAEISRKIGSNSCVYGDLSKEKLHIDVHRKLIA